MKLGAQEQDLAALRGVIARQSVQLIGLLAVLALALVTVLLMVGRERTVVTPPTLQKSFWVEGDQVSGSYLEQMAGWIATLILDVSPGNIDYNKTILLQYAAPDAHGALAQAMEPTTGGVIFSAATGLEANAIAQVQAQVRRRLLRVFARRGLLPSDDVRAMGQWAHGGGFSVNGSVRIEAKDRAGRERLLRYCARPPLALDRLRELDPERLVYDHPKRGPGGSGPLLLTPLELLDRLAALVPPPRIHRHRYFGVLAPNSPLRTAVTALALAASTAPPAAIAEPAAEPAHRRAARYAWALLLARIYEVFPLVCPHCGGAMRIIAFITDGPTVRDILVHLGAPITPPTVAPARGPPLWELPPAGQREIDPQAQPAPDYEFDQRVAW